MQIITNNLKFGKSAADIKSLVDKVRKKDERFEMVLSNKQMDWLWAIYEKVDRGDYNLSANSIRFLTSCANGFFDE